jgi:hypothetical protein
MGDAIEPPRRLPDIVEGDHDPIVGRANPSRATDTEP